MHKEYFGEQIVEMHYAMHFIVLMIQKKVDVTTPQTMHHNFCHNNLALNVNPKTQNWRVLIMYIGKYESCIWRY